MKRTNPLHPARLGGLLSAQRRPGLTYLVSFLIPFIFIGGIWLICGVGFGNRMILAHDQWHQYYPFFHELRDRLQNGESLLHAWTGMGTGYLPLIAYYLASPMNLPIVLLPEALVLPYYTLTVLVKISLCGLFFAVMLRKLFDRSDFTIPIFSTAFALCAFLMGYYWNAIWLDSICLLPLVTLGAFSLLKSRKYVLYVLSLSLSILCSYYIGLFVCIFVVLLFIGYNVVNWDDLAGFGARLLRILLFSLIAVGMTAFLTLPAFLGLQSTSSTVNNTFPSGFALNMSTQKNWAGVFEAFCKVVSNTGAAIYPTTMEGLPNLYCGVGTLMLAALYLLCRRIPLRERLYCVFLLLLFSASFIFRALDFIWHGFHFPNMLPYRFSFLWSFVVVFMAYRAFTQLSTVRLRWVLALIVPFGFLLYCVAKEQGTLAFVFTLLAGLSALAGLAFYSLRRLPKTALIFGLCMLMLAESFSCAILGASKVSFTSRSSYPQNGEETRSIIQKMNRREEGSFDLWRAELAMKQSLNDPSLLGYRGVSLFSSAANSSVSQFLQSLGLAASVAGNRYSYQEADPFINALLGIKYLIDRDGYYVNSRSFTRVDNVGKVLLLQNDDYVPLGFLMDSKVLQYDPTDVAGLPYDRLNQLHKLMTGFDDELYHRIPRGDAAAEGALKITSKTDTSYSISGEATDDVLAVSFPILSAQTFCVYSKCTDCGYVKVYLNDEYQYSYTDKYGYLRCFGAFSPGDTLTLKFHPDSGKTGKITIGAAYFDDDVFARTLAVLRDNNMLTTLVSDTEIEGAISVREEGKLLYLSIPNDNGWTLTVDGEPARITPVGDAMIACRLEPGLHAIRLEYEAPGFSLGLKISFICLGVFLLAIVFALLARLATPPLDKVEMSLADPEAEALRRAEEAAASFTFAELDDTPPPDGEVPGGETLALPVLSGWDESEESPATDEPEEADEEKY